MLVAWNTNHLSNKLEADSVLILPLPPLHQYQILQVFKVI